MAVSDRYAVWVDRASSSDSYDRIYYYDLQADSDGDRYPDWLEYPSRPPATRLPILGAHQRRNPDIYDDVLVYEVSDGGTSTIGWASISLGGEQSTNIGTGTGPRIGKYGTTYYVTWETATGVSYRALPSGDPYSFAGGSSPDIGWQWLVYKMADGISRTDLNGSNPTNSQHIPGTTASSRLPCTDDRSNGYLAYLQGTGSYMKNQVYAVRHADPNLSSILISGTSDQASGEDYRINTERPTISNGVVYWQWTGTSGNGMGIAAADVAITEIYLYLGDHHRAKPTGQIKLSPGFSTINWYSAASARDRIGFYNYNARVPTPTADPGVGLLRTNLPDGVGGDPVGSYALVLGHYLPGKLYVRNLSPYTWTPSNCRLHATPHTPEGWPGHAGHATPAWVLRSYWGSSSETHSYSGPSVAPQGVAAFSWTIGPPTTAGRYAFDWTIEYWNGSSWSELSKCYPPGGSEGPLTVDLLKVRQDLSFRSFLDVVPGGLSDYIEASAYHWTDLGKDAIAKGYPNGKFEPDLGVDRASMCVYVYRADQSPAYTPPPVSPFSDVPTDYWAYKEICYCYEHGIVNGYPDGTFRPTDPVTRAMACVYLRRALGGGDGDYVPSGGYFCTDVTASHPFHDAVYWMAEQKHLQDRYPGPTFNPDTGITRGELCEFVTYGYRLTMPTQDFVQPW
jgi:hypothetical protein